MIPRKFRLLKTGVHPPALKWFVNSWALLGTINKFLPNYATVAAPLTVPLGKDMNFSWSSACQTALQTLRALLMEAPVLACPKEDIPYIVDTDASYYGIGGVLSQNIDGHVIAY